VEVDGLAYLGTHTTWHVHLEGGRRVTVTAPTQSREQPVRPGDRAELAWHVRDSVVLTA
jgi:ABC-type Fe3+/spermidine/putrescine transport system ATPase subunit